MLESWETREEGTYGVKLVQLALSLHQVCQELMCVCVTCSQDCIRVYTCTFAFDQIDLC